MLKTFKHEVTLLHFHIPAWKYLKKYKYYIATSTLNFDTIAYNSYISDTTTQHACTAYINQQFLLWE